MKYKHLALVLSMMYANFASATTLNEALSLAYTNSQPLKVAQQTFIGEIQSISEALSGFMPRIGAEIGVTDTQQVRPASSSIINKMTRNLQITQPLFNGGGTVAAVKAAQSSFRASKEKLYSTEQEIMVQAVDAYLSYYEAKESYEISNTSVEFNQQTFDATEERLKLGEATLTDVALARAKLAKAQADRAMASANLQSTKALNIKIFGTELTDLVLPEIPSGVPDTLDSLTQKAVTQNPILQATKNSLSAAKSNSFASKAALLPSADLGVSVGTNYEDPTIASNSKKSMITTLTVHIPILSKGGAEYAAVRRANSAARAAAHQLEDQLGSVKANAIGAWEGYQASKAAITFAEEAAEASALALDGVKHEYAVGSKTIIDVLDAESQMNRYKIDNITTKKNYILAAYKIKASIGECTAKAMHLPVKYFKPEAEFQKVKAKIIGF